MLKLALPKGRIQENVYALLRDAGMPVRGDERGYRPIITNSDFSCKVLKPQNIVEMLHFGSRDLGFTGADWVEELGAEVVEVLDLQLDPVRIIAAASETLDLNKGSILIASEYVRLAEKWMGERQILGKVVRSYGATEVFPPEDADVIVDNTSTGATLRSQGLVILDTLLTSTTRLYASKKAWTDPEKRGRIESFSMLLKSVLDARLRVLLELNVNEDNFAAVVKLLPCMKQPTVAHLAQGAGMAVKAAVLRADLPRIIPQLKTAGATDLLVSSLSQIVL